MKSPLPKKGQASHVTWKFSIFFFPHTSPLQQFPNVTFNLKHSIFNLYFLPFNLRFTFAVPSLYLRFFAI